MQEPPISSLPLLNSFNVSSADIELVSRRTFTLNPEAEPGVQEDIPADFPEPNIELRYEMPPGIEVRCRWCRSMGARPNHRIGYVVRAANGLAILVGGTCGSKHFGDRWGIIEGVWKTNERRRQTIARLIEFEKSWPSIRNELFQVLHGPMWENYKTFAANFDKQLPKLSAYLLKMMMDRGGDLYVMERFRDLEAEMKLPDTNRKQVFGWREKAMGSIQGREFLTGAQHLKSSFGQQFDLLRDHVDELKELGSDLTTPQLKAHFLKISETLKLLRGCLSNIRSLQRFVDPNHLQRICDCATDWHKHHGKKDHYRFDRRFIVWSDPDQNAPLKCPIEFFEVPRTPKLDLFMAL